MDDSAHLLAKPCWLLFLLLSVRLRLPPPWRLPLISLAGKSSLSLQLSLLVPPQESGDIGSRALCSLYHAPKHNKTFRSCTTMRTRNGSFNEHQEMSEHQLERTSICQQPPACVFHSRSGRCFRAAQAVLLPWHCPPSLPQQAAAVLLLG